MSLRAALMESLAMAPVRLLREVDVEHRIQDERWQQAESDTADSATRRRNVEAAARLMGYRIPEGYYSELKTAEEQEQAQREEFRREVESTMSLGEVVRSLAGRSYVADTVLALLERQFGFGQHRAPAPFCPQEKDQYIKRMDLWKSKLIKQIVDCERLSTGEKAEFCIIVAAVDPTTLYGGSGASALRERLEPRQRELGFYYTLEIFCQEVCDWWMKGGMRRPETAG